MINKYERKIINKLLDKYENSKTFIGDNKVNQKFCVNISSLFPKYLDHSKYEEFENVNEAIKILTFKQLILSDSDTRNTYNKIFLNINKLEDSYVYITRTSKKNINDAVLKILNDYSGKNDVLAKFCNEQCKRIESNKSVEFYSNTIEFEKILFSVDELFKLNDEIFERNFSIKLFNDSKSFQQISNKISSLLYEYGDFPEKNNVLSSLNIIKNPTYVNFKGNAKITLSGQEIDLSRFQSDIAISSKMLCDVEKIEINCKSIITIENLTSFNTFNDKNKFAIYLGGFHNNIRREFIKKIYLQNPEIEYFHFGDIDAGGFYILDHLIRKTGVNFHPYKMDIETLKIYHKYTKKLTINDTKRLNDLLHSTHKEVVKYMLDNNCKLEQEAISIYNI